MLHNGRHCKDSITVRRIFESYLQQRTRVKELFLHLKRKFFLKMVINDKAKSGNFSSRIVSLASDFEQTFKYKHSYAPVAAHIANLGTFYPTEAMKMN